MFGDLGEWVALRLTRGVGDATFHRLLMEFGSPGAVFRQKPETLAAAGLPRATASRLARGLDPLEAEAQLRAATALGARIVPFGDSEYPAALRDLAEPPPLLWALGALPARGDRRVAIVGTRSPDGYGMAQALRIAEGCARAGCWIISGGARGVDARAHEGALAAKGRTLVVLGSGLDVPYPADHRALFTEVVQNGGGIVSELPLGTRPTRGTFPRRNRIIAALGEALCVVQAGARSGALLTAADAKALGRPVLALPGPVDRPPSAGVHRLLREGAALCEAPADVLGALGLAEAPRQAPVAAPHLGGDERQVLAALAGDPAPFDEVAVRAGLPVARAADALLSLELRGLLLLDRGYYRKKD